MDENFQPVKKSFEDSWLQIRVRPWIFASVWLVFGFLLPMAFSFVLSLGLPNDFNESLASISLPLMFTLLFNSLLSIYIIAVLGSIIRAFREKKNPTFYQSVLEGWKHLSGLLLTTLFLFMKFIPCLFLIVLGLSIANSSHAVMNFLEIFVFMLSVFMLFHFFLNYGLSPFIHFSTGAPPAQVIEKAQSYYNKRRKTVSWLFFLFMILPTMAYFYLGAMIIGSGTIAQFQAFLIFSNLLPFFCMTVYINFAMNEFGEKIVENQSS